jgi:hypothetical protein
MNRMGLKSVGLNRDQTEVDYSEHCLDLPFLNQQDQECESQKQCSSF